MTMSRRPQKAYALVIVLGMTLVLSALSLAVLRSQSSVSSTLTAARRELAQSILIQNTQASLGLRLNEKVLLRDRVRLNQDFSESLMGETLKVRWRERTGSVHRPVQSGYAKGDSLFEPAKRLPFTGYGKFSVLPALSDIILPPGHTAVGFDLSGAKAQYQTVYSGLFPYALSAPQGTVSADSVKGFSNHTFEEAEGTLPVHTGVPAWVRAEGSIHVEDFPVGRAISNLGPIDVRGGALALQVEASRDRTIKQLIDSVGPAASKITAGALDKTEAFVGSVLDPAGLLALITGNGNIWTLGSAQQATMVPFFPFPTLQTTGVTKVVMLHHPWPPDFNQGQGDDLAKKVKNLIDAQSKLTAERLRLRGEVAELWQKIQDNPNHRELPKWKARHKKLRKDVDDIDGQIQKLNREIDTLKKLLEERAWRGVKGVAPRHAGKYRTLGWAYLYILQEGVEVIAELYKPGTRWEDILSRLMNPVRLFHFGGRDPEWYFPNGRPKISDGHPQRRPAYVPPTALSVKGTTTVPPGRTLRINEHFQVRGDLWLQKGSTLHVKGNLDVRAPSVWTDRFGKEIYKIHSAFPAGRLMIEEGASLIVDGNLTCMGGNPTYGSILVVGPINRVHPISSAIVVKQDLKTRHGIHGATNVEELLAYARSRDTSYAAAHEAATILSVLYPNLTRLSGPFEQRDCYFSDFNSNLTFVLVKGVYVPVPVPLPLGNCMVGIFDALSWVSSGQLNLRLGPYFYPQASTWLFGRGVTPVILKTTPESMVKLLDPLRNLPDLSHVDLRGIFQAAVRDTVESVLLMAAKKFLKQAVKTILGSKVPGNVACLPWGNSKPKPPEAVGKVVKEVLAKIGKQFKKGILKVLESVRLEAQRHYVGNPSMFTKELPGVFVYCGGSAAIGTSPNDSILATGFFVVQDDLRFNTKKTIGAAVSTLGDISAHEFLYYPFFTSASLYNPLKPKDYKIPGGIPHTALSTDELRDILEVGLPVNRSNDAAIDLKAPGGRIIYEGWN